MLPYTPPGAAPVPAGRAVLNIAITIGGAGVEGSPSSTAQATVILRPVTSDGKWVQIPGEDRSATIADEPDAVLSDGSPDLVKRTQGSALVAAIAAAVVPDGHGAYSGQSLGALTYMLAADRI